MSRWPDHRAGLDTGGWASGQAPPDRLRLVHERRPAGAEPLDHRPVRVHGGRQPSVEGAGARADRTQGPLGHDAEVGVVVVDQEARPRELGLPAPESSVQPPEPARGGDPVLDRGLAQRPPLDELEQQPVTAARFVPDQTVEFGRPEVPPREYRLVDVALPRAMPQRDIRRVSGYVEVLEQHVERAAVVQIEHQPSQRVRGGGRRWQLPHRRDRRPQAAPDDHVEPALGWLCVPDHERLHPLNGAPLNGGPGTSFPRSSRTSTRFGNSRMPSAFAGWSSAEVVARSGCTGTSCRGWRSGRRGSTGTGGSPNGATCGCSSRTPDRTASLTVAISACSSRRRPGLAGSMRPPREWRATSGCCGTTGPTTSAGAGTWRRACDGSPSRTDCSSNEPSPGTARWSSWSTVCRTA